MAREPPGASRSFIGYFCSPPAWTLKGQATITKPACAGWLWRTFSFSRTSSPFATGEEGARTTVRMDGPRAARRVKKFHRVFLLASRLDPEGSGYNYEARLRGLVVANVLILPNFFSLRHGRRGSADDGEDGWPASRPARQEVSSGIFARLPPGP